MDRRRFLQLMVSSGLAASLHGKAWGRVIPSIIGGANPLWAYWDGTEAGNWDTTNTHIMVVAGGLGNDEIGYGALTAAVDNTWTQNGNIAAASGGRRLVDNNTPQYFTVTQNFTDAIFSGSTYTYLVKADTLVTPAVDSYFLYFTNGGLYLYLGFKSTGVLSLQSNFAGGITLDTTAAIPATGTFWVGFWSDGQYFRAGFTSSVTTGVPFRWSQFPESRRVSAFYNANLNSAFNATRDIFFLDAARTNTGYLQCGVMSKDCLINNNS